MNDSDENTGRLGLPSTNPSKEEERHKNADKLLVTNSVLSSKLLVDNLTREMFDSSLPPAILEVLEAALLSFTGVNVPKMKQHIAMEGHHC